MSERPTNPTALSRYSDGTTCARIYPQGTPFERFQDTEPIFEVWRDLQGNVIDRPNPELYPDIRRPPRRKKTPDEVRRDNDPQRRLKEWPRNREVLDPAKGLVEEIERWLGKRDLSPEEYQRYREAVGEHYDVKIWEPGPAPRPRPQDFKGTSP